MSEQIQELAAQIAALKQLVYIMFESHPSACRIEISGRMEEAVAQTKQLDNPELLGHPLSVLSENIKHIISGMSPRDSSPK